MPKNVLVISTSLRSGGNSDTLADAFLSGAREAGHHAEKIGLSGKTLGFCQGCLSCQRTGDCIMEDDASAIVHKMMIADVIAFATPVYFYDMCGQLKVLLDRSNPLFAADYAFRDIYLLATAADGDERAMDGTITGLNGWVMCFDKATLRGTVRATGVTAADDIQAAPQFTQQAHALGASV